MSVHVPCAIARSLERYNQNQDDEERETTHDGTLLGLCTVLQCGRVEYTSLDRMQFGADRDAELADILRLSICEHLSVVYEGYAKTRCRRAYRKSVADALQAISRLLGGKL